MALSLFRKYSLVSSFQNLGERILFTFGSLWADYNGASASQVGIMLSLQNILAFAGQNIFGRLSDRHGRTVILLFGFMLSALTSFAMFQVFSPLLIILVFSLYNIGYSAVQPSWNALIGDSFDVDKRAKMLGNIGAFASLAGGIFYLMTGNISQQFSNPYVFLFGVAAISFSGAFVSVFLVSRTNDYPQNLKNRKQSQNLFEPLQIHSFRRFVFADALFAFSMSTTWPLFPHATNNLANSQQVAIIWFFAFLGFSVTARYNEKLRDVFRKYRYTFFFSRFFLFLVPIGFAFATDWTHLLLVRILAGTTFGLYSITQKDYILDTCNTINRPDDRGWFLGTHAFIWGIMTFLGSLCFGFFADYALHNVGYSELFLLTSLLRLIFSFAFLTIPEPSVN